MRKVMSKFVDYEVSSGNVFRDLGLPDADELDIKANLAIKIGQIIARRGLSQVKAAALLASINPRCQPSCEAVWKNSRSSGSVNS